MPITSGNGDQQPTSWDFTAYLQRIVRETSPPPQQVVWPDWQVVWPDWLSVTLPEQDDESEDEPEDEPEDGYVPDTETDRVTRDGFLYRPDQLLRWVGGGENTTRYIIDCLEPGREAPEGTVFDYQGGNLNQRRYLTWYETDADADEEEGPLRAVLASGVEDSRYWQVDEDFAPISPIGALTGCACTSCAGVRIAALRRRERPLRPYIRTIEEEETGDMPRTAEHTYYHPEQASGYEPIFEHPLSSSFHASEAWNIIYAWRRSQAAEDVRQGLANVAYQSGYPSGFAALDALRQYVASAYGYSNRESARTLSTMADAMFWNSSILEFLMELRDDADTYIEPMEYPPPCRCGQMHCDRCFPQGPVDAGCTCIQCRPPDYDDQQDYDAFEGLPVMPDEAEGRCRFGIEVEFNRSGPRDYTDIREPIAQQITRAGIACLTTGYTHELARFWKMTTDGTVTGGECVSPILPGDDDSIEQVREVLRIIKAHGGCTGQNVGMHVHLDVTQFRTRELKALAKNLRRLQNFLAAFVPEHRYNGTNGCGATLMSTSQWDRIENWLNDVNIEFRNRSRENRSGSCPVGRYVAFNFNSLLTYGTVECRLLGHTLNTIKVRTWIRVLQTIVSASRQNQVVPMRADVFAWLTEYGLEDEHAAHFRAVAESRGNEALLRASQPGETPSNPNYDEDEDEYNDSYESVDYDEGLDEDEDVYAT